MWLRAALTSDAAAIRASSSSYRKYAVAVRVVCDFTAKAADLDRRFTPSPSAQEGVAGHRIVASRRGADHEREVTVYDRRANRLAEFKTYGSDFALA
jgi:DNA excision repair protein ERCC-2